MNNELADLARNVLEDYTIKPEVIKVIQSGGIKTVWKVDTSEAAFCLKRLRHPLDKALFTIQAQDYLARKGAKVPAIVPTRNGELYAVSDNQIFVVYQWVKGTNINLDNRIHLEQGLQGLAGVHVASAGFEPPSNCTVSSKLGRWPHHYTSMINRLKEWKQIAANSANNSFSSVFLKHVDSSISIGEKALTLLGKSYYSEWVHKTELSKTLCHQDYGDGNALIAADGVYVIDLDGVTFDLPIRDLRKIINKRMSKAGTWDANLLKTIINCYSRVNSLNRYELQVLAIDLLFPHEFHDISKNPYRNNKTVSSDKLARAAKMALGKEKSLESFISGLS